MARESAEVHEHRVRCADCRQWVRDAQTLTELIRSAEAARAVPDVSSAVLTQLMHQPSRGNVRVTGLRVALAVVAVAQLLLALPSLVGGSLDMPMSTHDAHESAAFSIALAVGLLTAAWRPAAARALLPLTATFVLVLGVLSVHDLADGAVALGRLATHLAAVAGAGVLWALQRAVVTSPPTFISAQQYEINAHDLQSERGFRGAA